MENTPATPENSAAAPDNPAASPPAYLSDVHWVTERPRSLVVCCSDGRLQKSTDDFLHERLGVDDYDRLYAPGGPAVLSDAGAEHAHTAVFRHDLEFLFHAHRIAQVVLIFHGAADDGPHDAACAYYRRTMPDGVTHAEMARRQSEDAADVRRYIAGILPGLEVLIFRAEVEADSRVRFLSLAEAPPA